MTKMQTVSSRLIDKGVDIPCPASVVIDEAIDPDRIDPGVVIGPGCRIYGADTLICRGAVIGHEAPATVENCFIGPDADLKGGFYKDAVFLKGASTGSGAHVREGTIFEEYASAAHTVGVKQTVLFPFVTLGSLINFCDCLMSGGTGPKDHSEVGSSYIHFNFTPQQDKATPSLLGEVARGVMLNQSPIFLGGQGGLVGPTRLAFGTVTAAGTICRKDELRPNRLIYGSFSRSGNIAYTQEFYRNVKRIVINNLIYIANLFALHTWYHQIRPDFISTDMPAPLLDGLQRNLDRCIEERINRLRAFSAKLPVSAEIYRSTAGKNASERLLQQKAELHERWDELETAIRTGPANGEGGKLRDRFLKVLDTLMESSEEITYTTVIKSLSIEDAEIGSAWLQGIVDGLIDQWIAIIPAFENRL